MGSREKATKFHWTANFAAHNLSPFNGLLPIMSLEASIPIQYFISNHSSFIFNSPQAWISYVLKIHVQEKKGSK